MANTSPVTDTAEAALRVLDLGREAGLVDVQPVGAVTRGLGGEELAELGLMARSRARVRVFSDDGKCVHDARVMRRALEYVKAFGGVVSQHAQDPTLAGPASCCHEGELSGRLGLPGWPGIAEEVIVARDVMLARHTGSRVHVAHVSTAGSVEVLRWAKAQGIDVTAEVTPHHLLLTTDLLTGYDPTYKVNPPLRPQEDVDALREALADGTIDAVATDHAPHARHDKEHAFVDAAFGMLGLETALGVVRTALPGPVVGAGRPGHVDHPGPHRRAGRPRLAGARHPGARHAGRPGRDGDRRPGRLGVAVAQQPLARPGARLAGRAHGVRRAADRPRRRAGLIAAGHASTRGRSTTVEPRSEVERARGVPRVSRAGGSPRSGTALDRHRPGLAGGDAVLRAGHRGRRRDAATPAPRATRPAGWCTSLDDRTDRAAPERPGNRRGSTATATCWPTPHVGLDFLIPGRGDTLRINGPGARLVDDAPFFDDLAVHGRRPILAMVVEIETVFFHCAKAFSRSRLWDPESWAPTATVPRRAVIAAAARARRRAVAGRPRRLLPARELRQGPLLMAHPQLLHTVLDAVDVRREAEFWRELLGLVYRPGDEVPDGRRRPRLAGPHRRRRAAGCWPSSRSPSRRAPPGRARRSRCSSTSTSPSPAPRSSPQQHDRALALGATVLLDRTDDEDEPLYVFADPEGHPFCIFVA